MGGCRWRAVTVEGGGGVWFQRCEIGVDGLPMKQSTAVKKRKGEVEVFVIHFG